MLKPYKELVKIDVTPFCDYREAKDDKGNMINVPYLNWAKCVELLHEYGAEVVYFEPLYNEHGHSLFMSDQEFEDKNGNKNRCYEVRVRTVVDDKTWVTNHALMNGSYVVRNDTMNQLRVSNAQARAFVKGVALHTGLGFNLWIKDLGPEESPEEDLSYHSIYAIKKRVEILMTEKIKRGMEYRDILSALGISEKQWKTLMKYFDHIGSYEQRLRKL